MNTISSLKIVVASDLDHECLVAEIYCDEKYVALLSQDDGLENLMVVFPDAAANQAAVIRDIDLKWLRHALERAERVLLQKSFEAGD
ncbi:hypothetical protein PTE30175_05526 [Pandoraea terrae]|uniref:Uncharacterized protein n=1 Tax=Pandoraea terrae TaxID=1537710 RepID=A0A5E4ZG31_9BURK|nr:hypothetical protein [Pandoraea terrae]VVE59597.1 hypothetical protein PTE30175_05526 [Pandoraea terrae]